jgi:hypothetical protein
LISFIFMKKNIWGLPERTEYHSNLGSGDLEDGSSKPARGKKLARFHLNKPGMVMHTCKLSCVGGHREKDSGLWPAGKNARPNLKTKAKKSWVYSLSGRGPAYQALRP